MNRVFLMVLVAFWGAFLGAKPTHSRNRLKEMNVEASVSLNEAVVGLEREFVKLKEGLVREAKALVFQDPNSLYNVGSANQLADFYEKKLEMIHSLNHIKSSVAQQVSSLDLVVNKEIGKGK